MPHRSQYTSCNWYHVLLVSCHLLTCLLQDNLTVFGTWGSVVGNQIVLDSLETTPTPAAGGSKASFPILSFPADRPGGSVVRYLKHFEACLREDRTPLVDVREGARGIAVVEACWESIKNGGRPARVRSAF